MGVQRMVVQKFRPNNPDDTDYSPAITAFVKAGRVQTREARFSPYSDREVQEFVALAAFRKRYPIDDRAFAFLLDSEMRMEALEGFRPKQEGESDYSGLVTRYLKNMRPVPNR